MKAALDLIQREIEIKQQQLLAGRLDIKPQLDELQKAITALSWPTNYRITSSWRQRVLRVLEHLQVAYVTDILAVVLEKQPEIDVQKAKQRITHAATVLHSAGWISAKKEATRNLYFISPVTRSRN